MVETPKGLVRSMTGSRSPSKHNKTGIAETANANNMMNNLILNTFLIFYFGYTVESNERERKNNIAFCIFHFNII